MTDQAPLPSAGWYADPEQNGQERWWNGSSWSDQRRAAVPTGPAAGSGSPSPPAPAYVPPAPGAPSPYAAPVYGAPVASPTNGFALAGLICACAGLFLYGLPAIVGLVLSILGYREAKRREALGMPNTGRGLALAGIIVGGVLIALGAIAVLVFVVVTLNTRYS